MKRASAQKTTIITKQQAQTELGTSVAPRQRPKGNASSQNLPLVLPSSPSPRNVVASPSSQVLQSSDSNYDTSEKPSAIPLATTPVSPYAVKVKPGTIQNDHKTPTKPDATGNLFEATFNDSFNDTVNVTQTTPTIDSKNDTQSLTSPMHQSLLNASKAMTSGHRRNMSDTSAFNK